MRHDDMISTATNLAEMDSPEAQAAGFRQLIDLSLQGRDCSDIRLKRRALRAMLRRQADVPVTLRNRMIDEVVKRGGDALHLRLFRHGVSNHYDRLLQVAELSESDWWRFARRAPAHLRAGMLARRDLPAPVRELIDFTQARGSVARNFVPDPSLAHHEARITDPERFAPPPVDAKFGTEPVASPSIAGGQGQVRELIDRIAAFRTKAVSRVAPLAPTDTAPDAAVETAPLETPRHESNSAPGRWTWRCDANGVFVDSPDMPEWLVGVWLTEFRATDAPGQLVRAVERRVPFRDVIVELSDAIALKGRFRISGLPQFDRGSGRFTGYWGTAIALEAPVAETAPRKGGDGGLFGTGASSEALSTMAHEVRTPLNAIIGFAQLIEGEVLGEAGDAYKDEAGNILYHAEKLLGAFDDLNDAARIDQGRYQVSNDAFDVSAQISAMVQRYVPLAKTREIDLVPLVADGLPEMNADSSVFERAVSRLLTVTLASARKGEAIHFVVQRGAEDCLRIVVTRPQALAGMSAETLFDPAGIAVDHEDAPLLGIGFGLKLVDSLVGTMGGAFDIGAHQFELRIPNAAEKAAREAS